MNPILRDRLQRKLEVLPEDKAYSSGKIASRARIGKVVSRASDHRTQRTGI